METFTCAYIQQTLSILQTFCEPIFGFQCVLDSTDGDRIADRVSLYRHNPCLSAPEPSGSTFANPLPTNHPVTPPSMFSIHFPLSSPWLLLFESHPNCSVWELDLFSLLSQPPLSMSCPQCTSSPIIEFSSGFLPPESLSEGRWPKSRLNCLVAIPARLPTAQPLLFRNIHIWSVSLQRCG